MGMLKLAKSLGLDSSKLEKGEVIDTVVSVPDIDTFRELFGGSLTDEQRAGFSAATPDLDDHPAMKALVQHVFGSGALDDAARDHAGRLFPTTVKLTAGSTVTIDTDITVGPLGQPYAIVTDALVFAGGSLTMLATSLTIQAGTVTVSGAAAAKPYHIGIFGEDGTQPPQAPPGQPYANAAKSGSNSSPPSPGICTGAAKGGNGTDGSKGNTGSPGEDGSLGQPSYPASITITSFDPASTGALVLQTQSGAGGAGGQGGNGGQGQNGGNGGKGCDSGCEGTSGGNGGDAGAGGDGGPGGNGVDGVSGYPINVSIPMESKQMLQTVSIAAQPGVAGQGGKGGPPGSPGSGGKGGKGKSNGKTGSGAASGATGAAGTPGQQTGAPGQIILSYT